MAWARMIAPAMEREYELFERRGDGVLSWRGVVVGLSAARVRTRLLSIETDNECFAVYGPERSIVARALPLEPAELAA